jgi:hypothetical protein
MKRELDEKLRQKYPSLYCDRDGDKTKTSMHMEFACGDGWYELIDVVSGLLTEHNPEIRAEQIKEKLGTLRFYHSPVDDYSIGIETAAGQLSCHICEVCGEPAMTNSYDGGWWSTLCVKHREDRIPDKDRQLDLSGVAIAGFGLHWSKLMVLLRELCEWNTERNGMPEATLDIQKVGGRLIVNVAGGNDFTKGMTDLYVAYANRVDEHTGLFTAAE